jgi:hypothetical protein
LDFPDSEHVVSKQEEEGEEMQPLPVHPTCKDTFTALVLDYIITAFSQISCTPHFSKSKN